MNPVTKYWLQFVGLSLVVGTIGSILSFSLSLIYPSISILVAIMTFSCVSYVLFDVIADMSFEVNNE